MSTRNQVFVTPDHRSVDHYAALLADGTPAPDTRTDRMSPLPGHAGCSCGLVSPGPLGSRQKRKAWHTRHREETAGAPWSDAVRRAEEAIRAASKWPAILNSAGEGTFYVWRERSRGCWEATGAEGFVVRVAVVETADGTGDTWVGHTISDNLGAGAVETIYFRMLDLLAERLRTPEGGGWEVGCRACGEAWPCPVRELVAHPHPQALPRPDALDHVPYGVIRRG